MSRAELLDVASGIVAAAVMGYAGWLWWAITP